jgi:hypothetical protein
MFIGLVATFFFKRVVIITLVATKRTEMLSDLLWLMIAVKRENQPFLVLFTFPNMLQRISFPF